MKRLIPILLLIPALYACGAEIGDDCTYDVDCSTGQDRYCDSSQPGGYCLIIGCGPDECPAEASCVNFVSPCPTGDGYEDGANCSLIESTRERTYCMKHCKSDGDCRDKYRCVEAVDRYAGDLYAEIIDYSGGYTKICVPAE